MDLDIKQQVLVAIYTEYQKDLPDMKEITHKKLGIPINEFNVALDKLDNEGMVNNLRFIRGGDSSAPRMAITDYAKMNLYGIEYVENKLGIEKTLSAKEKVERIVSKTTEFGFEQLKDFGAKVVAEMISKATGISK